MGGAFGPPLPSGRKDFLIRDCVIILPLRVCGGEKQFVLLSCEILSMNMQRITWDTALDSYPLAEERIQRHFDPNWSEEYSDQFHSVRMLAPGVYGRCGDDLGTGGDIFAGIIIFSDPDNPDWYDNCVSIDVRRVGWSLRLRQAIASLT